MKMGRRESYLRDVEMDGRLFFSSHEARLPDS